MIKKLVSIGCSWPYGDELIDPDFVPARPEYKLEVWAAPNKAYRESHAYPGLIAEHFGLELVDLSFPGGTQKSNIWNLNWWLDNTPLEEIRESFILHSLTDESRTSWFNPYHQPSDPAVMINHHANKCMHTTWLKENFAIKDEPYMDEWRQFFKLYMQLSDCRQAHEMYYAEAVRFFDGIAARYQIPLLQVNVLAQQHEPKLDTLLNNISLMEVLVLRDKPRKDPLFKPGKHPNEKGHRILADYLIERIESANIL